MLEVTVGIISAVVSLVVALLTVTLKNKADFLKIQKEQEHGFAKALFEKRVEHYPELYNLLSEYGKFIQNGKQNLDNLAEFKRKVDDWNSKHSLFFTRPTARFSSRFRRYLGLALNRPSNFLESEWKDIDKMIAHFEHFLKAEIGIFTSKPISYIDEYEDAYSLTEKLIREKENSLQRSAPNNGMHPTPR